MYGCAGRREVPGRAKIAGQSQQQPRWQVIEDLSGVEPGEWNRLVQPWHPFNSYEFLRTLETTGCVAANTGWTPQHIILRDEQQQLIGALPLYLKDHSWGEFVFDFAWAQAWHEAGLSYYPKLVSMTPFTPVTGNRLLVANNDARLRSVLLQALRQLAQRLPVSSFHILYPHGHETAELSHHGLEIREDCRFLWQNRGYQGFDDFLGQLRAARRKDIRRERRRINQQRIHVETHRADQLDSAAWQSVYTMITRTFVRRGHTPYLSLKFFQKVAAQLGERMLVNLAMRDAQPVGAAIFFRDDIALFGRYWGCLTDIDCLHFETCYYTGIEYCIRHGLSYFDPGTQGEHKVRRGFSPVKTYSAHFITEQRFREPIRAWIAEERDHVAEYIRLVGEHLPYRR